jgi:hypothetical protein
MAEFPANPTDAAICRLLAVERLPTAAIADRLGAPERTVRHRLYRLRQAGAVVTGPDGLHSLAGSAPPTDPPGTLPAWAAPAIDLAAPLWDDLAPGPLPTPAVSTVTAQVAGSVPSRVISVPATLAAGPLPASAMSAVAAGAAEPWPTPAAPAMAADQRASAGPSAGHGGRGRERRVLATAALGLAVAGGLAVMVRTRRMSPPPPPAPPSEFGNASDPWGSMRGPTW